MASTYEAIMTYTVPSAQSSYTFTSISQAYTDLVLIVSGSLSANEQLCFQFNSDTAGNYSFTRMYGTGSAIGNDRQSNFSNITTGTITTSQGQGIFHIQNYSNTTTNKTLLARTGGASDSTWATVGLWRSTSAINTIKVYPTTGNFNTGSTFTLYGIKAA